MKHPPIHRAALSLALAALVHATPWGWSQEPAGTVPAPPDQPAETKVAAPADAAAAPADKPAEPQTPTPADKITLNFRNAPVDAVLDHLSKAAGFVIVKDTPVTGTVDVWSHQPLTPDEAVELLNTVLARQNLAAVRSDRVLRIITREAALKADLPVEHGADPEVMPRSEAMATQIIPIKHADAAKMVENLKPLLGDKAQMSANASSNSLILTDTRTNIRRITLIVQALDSSISSITEIRVFPLEHAEAEDIAKVINEVFEEPDTQQNSRSRNRMDFFRRMRGGGGPPGMGGGNDNTDTGTSEAKTASSKVTAVGDERSNCVVVSASSEIMPQIATLVKQVDVPTQDDAVVEVYELKYADAEDVVEVLQSIYSESSSSTANANIPGSRRGGMFGGPPGMMMMRGGNNSSSSSRSLGQADVTVVADTRTNSVVVSASPSTMTAISKVIAKLDETPKNVTQIYIYHIENADLENLQEILEGMFEDIEDTGTTTSLAPGGGQAGNTGGGGMRRN